MAEENKTPEEEEIKQSESAAGGEIRIANDVVVIIAGLAATEVEGVESMDGNVTNALVNRLGMKNLSRGIKVDVTDRKVSVDIALNLYYGYTIPEVCAKVQDHVKNAIESMTGLEVSGVNVKICGVKVQDETDS